MFDTVFAPEKDGEEVQWRSMPVCDDASQPWLMDLDRAIGGNDRVAYAKTVLVAPDAIDAVLEIGSDDGVKVWLNGELVHANHAIRPVTLGEDKARVRLEKGDNSVLMKITQAGGGWGFCLRVTHPDGTPLLELNTKKITFNVMA